MPCLGLRSKPVPAVNLTLKMAYSEIQQATENFNPHLVIGEGAFGRVYKSTLQHGLKAAVKVTERGPLFNPEEFEKEIMELSQIQHPNLVSLLGYCIKGLKVILVYEYMENGSLRDHLYVSDGGLGRPYPLSELSWVKRLKICIDVAEGLQYLHGGLPKSIIHYHLKSANIMLGKNFNAKIADFGISRSGFIDPDERVIPTLNMDHVAPESLLSHMFKETYDVYSFGVVLLEVLSARPARITTDNQELGWKLADWRSFWQKRKQIAEIIDPALLVGDVNPSSLRIVRGTAEKCLGIDRKKRPAMREVLWNLELAMELQQAGTHTEWHNYGTLSADEDLDSQFVQRFPSLFIQVEGDEGSEDGSTVSICSGSCTPIEYGR